MKTATMAIPAILLFCGATALGQIRDFDRDIGPVLPPLPPYPYVFEQKGSTPFGDYARGLGLVIRSAGQASLDSAVASLYFSQARRSEIENWRYWTETYFELRRLNRMYRAAERGPRPTMEDLIRYAQMGTPRRLTPSFLDTVSGQLNWPMLLQAERFNPYRAQIQVLFARRAQTGGLVAGDFFEAVRLIALMESELKDNIRQLPPGEYVNAQRFLESLAFEAGLPAG